MVAWFIFMLIITWSLSRVVGTIKIDNKKCKQIAGDLNHHADAVIQCGAHHPIEHIHCFTRSHWMPPSGKCLRRIALTAGMVHDFDCKHKNTNKTQLLIATNDTINR
jgi:hypothetical protein